jgi:DNA-binding LytR/AlgR family response regulator
MINKLTCYIVDDEPMAQEILQVYISKVPFLELKGSFDSPIDTTGQIEHDKPDILFLDVNMPDLDGLSFIPMLNPRPMIILTTAYDHHALKAYELEVMDYLLKPISFERFYKSVLRLYQFKSNREKEEVKLDVKNENDHLFIKVGHRIQKIATDEILLIEGMKDYLMVHTIKGKIMTLMTFTRLEELLHSANFIRVHKSFMVAIDKIEHIEKNRIKIAGQVIPISETYSEAFFKSLKGWE